LIHGDYFPEDVMVAGDGCICDVIDFDALTTIGDAGLDLAGQPAFDLQNR
jgi:aminoglycoside phosphotransferase (APT) family kinase protein